MAKQQPRKPKIPAFGGYSPRTVPGEGPVPASLMLVGEAPGFNEDESGRPFVGVAGQLLDTLLKQAEIPRSSVYITNAVKRRPPDNRDPTKAEINYYKPELLAEIERVNPRLIVAMGNIALLALTGRSGITARRGVEVDVNGRKVLPTFHTSYCLRKGGAAAGADRHSPTAIVREDLKRAARLLAGEVSVPPTTVQIVDTLNDWEVLVHGLWEAPVLSYDVETKGWDSLDPGSRLLGIGLTDRPGRAFYVLPRPQLLSLLSDFTQGRERKWVAHNGKFDNRWLRRYGIEVKQTFDTMLAAFLLNENRRMALEHLAVEELGAEPYHQQTQELLKAGRADEVPLEVLAARCGRDVDVTMRLYEKFKPQLEADLGLRRVFSYLLMPVSRLLEDVESAGLPVDERNLSQVKTDLEQKTEEFEAELRRLGGFAPDEKVNFNSTKVVADVLYTRLHLPIIKVTKKGAPSTGKKALLRLKEFSPFVDALMKHRKCKKYETAYCDRWLPRLRDGRLYGSYRFTNKDETSGIRTGRLAGDLQQMPREDTGKIIGVSIKNLIVARPGFSLLEADYSQVEPRIIAWLANDPAMLRIFQEGRDIYTETARAVLGATEITKEIRQKAKPVVLGFQYKLSPNGFRENAFEQYGLKFTEQESVQIRSRFFAKFAALPTYFLRQEAEVKKNLSVRTPLGRVRRLPDILSHDKELKSEAIRKAINTPVQATGNDFTLLAAVLAEAALPTSCGLIALVHDSLVWELPEAEVRSAARTVKQIMEQTVPQFVADKFKVQIPVPLVAEIKVGKAWGTMRPLTEA